MYFSIRVNYILSELYMINKLSSSCITTLKNIRLSQKYPFPMILLFFTSLLWSQQPSSPADLWIQIYEGRLTEAMDSNHEYAIEIYSALLENLSPDHPICLCIF